MVLQATSKRELSKCLPSPEDCYRRLSIRPRKIPSDLVLLRRRASSKGNLLRLSGCGLGLGLLLLQHLVRSRRRTHALGRLLQVGQVARLVVDVEHLLLALLVEPTQLLARGCAVLLVKVGRERVPCRVHLGGDGVLGVGGLGLLRRLVLGVEVLEGVGEAVGDAVLLVEGQGALDYVVGNDVAVGANVSGCAPIEGGDGTYP